MAERRTKLVLFLLACLTSLSLLHSPGTGDVSSWRMWVDHAEESGIAGGYRANHGDYPPLSTVILLVASRVSQSLGMTWFLGFKLSVFLFLLLTSVIFLLWTRDIFLAAIMQLSLTMNSMALGYLDIFFAPILVLALWAMRCRSVLLATLLFTIACLVKWQPAILAPFVIVYLLRIGTLADLKHLDLKVLLARVVLPCLLTLALFLGIFGVEMALAFGRAGFHRVLSGRALNLNWIITHLLHLFSPGRFGPLVDGASDPIKTRDLRIVLLPKLVFGAAYLMALIGFLRQTKSFENLLRWSLAGYMTYFIFNTGVHENHMFIPCILGIVLYSVDKKHAITASAVAIAANVNLLVFYGIDGRGLPFSRVVGVDMALVLSILFVLLFGPMSYRMIRARGDGGGEAA